MLTTTKHLHLESLRFLNRNTIMTISEQYGTPVFAYSEAVLIEKAKTALAFTAPYGLTVRYAMKANPLSAILKTFDAQGIHIDASSGFEAERAILAGIDPSHIMITSQQLAENLDKLVGLGVKFNATSLHQLESYGKQFPRTPLSIRINAGVGSGYRRGVSVAGPTASFGIWYQHIDQIKAIAKKYDLIIETIHSHIGCGNDPLIWHSVAEKTLDLVQEFPDVKNLNLGGGFKVARMAQETATDLSALGEGVNKLLENFASYTDRKLKLEIEPGTFLTANAGTLISRVQDMNDTGSNGFKFIKLDTGMNDITRPALHASQHPIIVVGSQSHEYEDYVVVGHNCESSDLLTPSPEDSELPEPRLLERAEIGDLIAIEGVGAYCASMRLIGYNSFPTPNEVMVLSSGEIKLINRRQSVKDLIASEVI